MAQRRMFSQKIVGSDAFLEMPTSTRELYFQLGMYADDDGFVNPKKIMRMIGASDDDLRMLIAKRFVLPFETGIIVVKHWRTNNQIRGDRYAETEYKREKSMLRLNENDAYTFRNDETTKDIPKISKKDTWQPNGNQMATQYRLGKDSIDIEQQKNKNVDNSVHKSYKDGDVIQLKDGTQAVMRFGVWVDLNNTNIKIDRNHYKELP